MKPNAPHIWSITLSGRVHQGRQRIETVDFIGTLDEALGRADEFESNVPFEVEQFVITRGAPVRSKK